jgi:hypothetical protein
MIAAAIDDNLDRIRSDLARLGLTYERLVEDVLDHVCCLVEEEMNRGIDFETSYDHVLGTIGESQLKEIQHHTLLNLDKKFQRMKNFTYLFGLTSALLTIVGAFFKRMHWPAAGILITVGIALVVLVFLPLYFVTNHREQEEKKNPIYAVVGYLTLALLLTSALFKIMHWPGANIMIQVAVGFLVIGFIPLYVVNVFQKSGKEKVRLPYIVMFLVGVSLVMMITNVRMSKYTIDLYQEEALGNEHDVEVVKGRTAKLLEMLNDTAYMEKKEMVTRIHDQARGLQVMISEMRESLLEMVDQPGVSIQDVKGKDIQRRQWEGGINQEREARFALEALKFQEMLDEILMDPVTRSQIGDHLKFTRKVWPYEFGRRLNMKEPFIVSYYMLSEIEKGVALTEYVSIDYILNH